ncbi:MAG TPA: GTPase Era [Gemmatimonadales bacterium]|nr:GTPase Era [Gemmatimonadales bacterium]
MTQCGHIALAGRPNVGKSSLLNALVGGHLAIVSPKAQATRLPVTGLRTEGEVQFVLHDLPGLLQPEYLLHERMRETALASVARVDVVLHLHPAADAPAPAFATLAGLPRPPRAPVLTVYTKADLVAPAVRSALAASGIPVSVEDPASIDTLLARITPLLPAGPFEFPDDELGTQPVRFFVTEYLREAAFTLLEEELPYAVTAEVEEFREERDPVYIRASLFVETESQKGIVIGRQGRMLKAIGAHARGRIEELLGRKVYLDTWVKVLPKWRRSAELLARFGFPPPSPE